MEAPRGRTIMAVVVAVIILACEVQPGLSAGSNELSDINGKFAIDFYKQIARVGTQTNIIYAPFSISTALAMTYLGARGRTASQMRTTLGFCPGVHQQFRQLQIELNDPNRNSTLLTANRLFGSDAFHINPRFIQQTATFYDGRLETLDFIDDPVGSRDFINDWVASKTNNNIKDLLPPNAVDPNTILVLVNAVYFKGLWKLQFNKTNTRLMSFFTRNRVVQTEFMTLHRARLNYWINSNLDARIVEIPYTNDEISMFIILPNTASGLANVERRMRFTDLPRSGSSKRIKQRVDLTIPKFKLDLRIEPKPLLQSLGITDLFSSAANLGGIGEGLYVKDVYHRAYIDVTEEGTEAAGSTAIVMTRGSPRTIQFKADHPFFFYIRDKRTDSIVFMGRYGGPDADN